MSGLWINPDRMGVSLLRSLDTVPHLPETCNGVRVLSGALKAHDVGEPRVVQPRGIDGGADIHVEIDHVHHDAQDGVDDRAAAGTAGYEHHLAVACDDGWRL